MKVAQYRNLFIENTDENIKSGNPSVASILKTLRSNIKKISILTAENPNNTIHSDEFNSRENFELERTLVSSKIKFKNVKVDLPKQGYSGNFYFVYNISLDSAISLGTSYKQESVIYGETEGLNNDGKIHMSFKLVGTDDSKPKKFKQVFEEINVLIDKNDKTDISIEFSGKKIIFPFIDVVERFIDNNGKLYDIKHLFNGFNLDLERIESNDEGTELNTSALLVEMEEYLNDLGERAIEAYGSSGYNLRSRIMEVCGR